MIQIPWKRLGKAVFNSIRAMLKGEFLFRAGFENYFPHIIYTVFLLWLIIFGNLQMEKTLVRKERNQVLLAEQELVHQEKAVRLMRLDRIQAVRDRLAAQGSQLDLPEKPAVIIKK